MVVSAFILLTRTINRITSYNVCYTKLLRRIERLRTQGKVRDLEALLEQTPLAGNCGIAHTRWATHGVPNTVNAHPHLSGESIALVHNGIIENRNNFV